MPRTATHTPPSAQADHAALIVAFDAGDLLGAERDRAGGLIATCDGCAELLADLAAIRVATAALPAPRRTRDFRLTDTDAARLRPTLRNRLLGWLAAPGSSVRPLAGGLAALGIAGLLLATTPGILSPGSLALAPEAATAAPASALDSQRNAAPVAVPPGGAAGAGQGALPSPEPRPAISTVPHVEFCVEPTAAASAAASAAAPAGLKETTDCAPRAAAVPAPATGVAGTPDTTGAAVASPATAYGPALLPVPAASAARRLLRLFGCERREPGTRSRGSPQRGPGELARDGPRATRGTLGGPARRGPRPRHQPHHRPAHAPLTRRTAGPGSQPSRVTAGLPCRSVRARLTAPGSRRTMGPAPKWRNRQTRRSQTPLGATSCGFDPRLRHHHRSPLDPPGVPPP